MNLTNAAKARLASSLLAAVMACVGVGCGANHGKPDASGNTEACTQDSDCGAGEICDTTTGQCEAPSPSGCTADSDCASGETCDTTTGFCQPASGTSCHQCACVDLLSAGGCANLCDSAQNGSPNTPNFCNGVSALPQCSRCLQDSCAAAGADPTEPSACQ